jgi:molybdopterin converting factor small subunit
VQVIQQQQVAPAVQTATITSSLELSGIPSVIPPSGSMERMALLNLLVHRIDSQLSSLTNNPVRDITILAIGDTDMTLRRLRGGGNNDVESADNRSLWSTIQVVKFQALLEYICGDKNEEECINNAQASADDVIRHLASKSPTVSPASSNNGVDNTGEDWSSINDPSSSYVWIPDPSNEVDYEVITSKPTSPPTFHPSLPPTANPTPSPTLTPSSLPIQSMQSYTVNIQIDTNIPEPTSSKPTSPSAITDNEWFTNAGFFQGEASKRFCGYDWNDVVTNCL